MDLKSSLPTGIYVCIVCTSSIAISQNEKLVLPL